MIALYSSIASGMLALTAIVFSLTFVMVAVQRHCLLSRLVLWVARDRVYHMPWESLPPPFLCARGAGRGSQKRVGNGPIYQWVFCGRSPAGQCGDVYRSRSSDHFASG